MTTTTKQVSTIQFLSRNQNFYDINFQLSTSQSLSVIYSIIHIYQNNLNIPPTDCHMIKWGMQPNHIIRHQTNKLLRSNRLKRTDILPKNGWSFCKSSSQMGGALCKSSSHFWQNITEPLILPQHLAYP